MPELRQPAYSYRSDPTVPDFPDDKPLFLFDGHCVLCSTGAAWIMRRAPGRVRFASAQSRLGSSLFRHYGVDPDASYLLIAGGHAFTESTGYLQLSRLLGGWWHLFRIFALVPRPVRDWAYRLVARNRYRWFGRVERQCELLTPEQQAQMLR